MHPPTKLFPFARTREHKMNIELESMAIEMPRVAGHPNREPFRGVLTLVDAASDKPPAGARGHRVLLTRAAAEAGLPSLLGMGLDYAPSLDTAKSRRYHTGRDCGEEPRTGWLFIRQGLSGDRKGNWQERLRAPCLGRFRRKARGCPMKSRTLA